MKVTIYKNSTNNKKCDALKTGKCRRKAKWLVFGGDGKPIKNRFITQSCSYHLVRAVNDALESNGLIKILEAEQEHLDKELFEI